MQLTIVPDVKPALAFLDDVGKRQMPFAFAKSLIDVSLLGRGRILERARSAFTMRTTWWTIGNYLGFKVKTANKKEGSHMYAAM